MDCDFKSCYAHDRCPSPNSKVFIKYEQNHLECQLNCGPIAQMVKMLSRFAEDFEFKMHKWDHGWGCGLVIVGYNWPTFMEEKWCCAKCNLIDLHFTPWLGQSHCIFQAVSWAELKCLKLTKNTWPASLITSGPGPHWDGVLVLVQSASSKLIILIYYCYF